MRNVFRAMAATLAVVAAAVPGAVSAATATGSFQVNMTVSGACSVVSASDLSFGAQTTIASNLDTSSTIAVQCTNSTPYTIGLSAGGGTGATVASRLLTAGQATIPYTIYRDSNRTQLWGSTTNVDTVGGTGSGASQSYTVYGRVAPVASPAAGSYSDTVAITVTY